jgi:hypothetical protein
MNLKIIDHSKTEIEILKEEIDIDFIFIYRINTP